MPQRSSVAVVAEPSPAEGARVRQLLLGAGFAQVLVCEDGLEALRLVGERRPDALLASLTLRPADGVELSLAGVRTEPPSTADEILSILEPVRIAYETKDAAWRVVASGARGGVLLGGLRAAGLPDDVLAAVTEVAETPEATGASADGQEAP